MYRIKPLRIVHCVRSPIGGIFRHILDLALEQTARGHQVGVICDKSSGGAYEDDIIAAAAPKLALGIQRFPMRRQISLSDIRATLSLLGSLRGLEVDILHGHGAKGGAYARLIGTVLGLGGRQVLRIYCPHGGSLHYDPASRAGRTYFRLERLLAHLTDGYVFVSDYEEASFRAKVGKPASPVCRVLNGLQPAEYEPIEPRPGMADLMYVGMMRDLKGPPVLLAALPILAERHGLAPTLRLTGAGDDRPAYEARVAAMGLSDRVTFHDPMPTRQALAQGRVLVVPSLAESMPYVVLESIAARIPLVATRVGGIPEIFAERADALVPPNDPSALADAIAALLGNEAAARADATRFGRALAGRFSVDKMTTDIVDFYGRLRLPRRHGTADGALKAGAAEGLGIDRSR